MAISLEEVGTHYRCDLDVVQLVDQLFWNFRDRRREPGYVAQLLYRNTRAPGRADRKEDEAQPGLRLIRLGYEQGYQAVLQAAGYSALVDQNVTSESGGDGWGDLVVFHESIGLAGWGSATGGHGGSHSPQLRSHDCLGYSTCRGGASSAPAGSSRRL